MEGNNEYDEGNVKNCGSEANKSATENSDLTNAQKARIEKNRKSALLLKQSKLIPHPYAKISAEKTVEKNIIKVQSSKFIDTGGGFLLEEDGEDGELVRVATEAAPIMKPDRPACEECKEEFEDSYLLQNFDYHVCDTCRDNDEKHQLITKTDAKNVYLLKDCDLEKREPPLKFIVKRNPHNVRWGSMKLYLERQVMHRALEVWGSEEELETERERREEERAKSKIKKYNKQLKSLRMSVRSSLYDHTNKLSHEHTFGPDTYIEADDTYTHTCTTCEYSETFEKM